MPSPALPSFAQVRSALLKAGVLPADSRKLPPPVDMTGEPVPEPVQPQTEGRPAYNAWRGGEMHGVVAPVALEPNAEGYGDGTVAVHYDETEEHVLPVRIVSGDEAETINAWHATQSVAPVAGERPPVQIVPRNRKRTKVRVQNIAAADGAWIGSDGQVSPSNGWWLAPGVSVDLSTTEPIYAVSGTANPVPLGVIIEYTLFA